MRLMSICNEPKRVIFASGELELLQRGVDCVSEDARPPRGVDCEIPYRLDMGERWTSKNGGL